MSLVTWLCAEVAWLNAAEHDWLPLPPAGGVAVDVVVDVVVEVEELDVDEPAHAVVAWVSAALTWP
jgi:hypothetical protein